MHATPLIVALLLGATPPTATTVMTTTAPITEYVSASGNDTNDCQSPGTACLTIQGALSVIPKYIAHQVQINVAAGTFSAGAYIEGFVCTPGANGATGAGIRISGTFTAAALGGSMTGSIASCTAPAGTTFSTCTVTAAGWTVNALRGYMFRITGGTGNGQIVMITANTATVVSLAYVAASDANTSTWAGYVRPDNTSTFEIDDWGTLINNGINTSPGPGGTASNAVTETNAAAFIIGNVHSSATGSPDPTYAAPTNCIQIDTFRFTGTNIRRAILAEYSDGYTARWNKVDAITTSNIALFTSRSVTQTALINNYTKSAAANNATLFGSDIQGVAALTTLGGNVTDNVGEYTGTTNGQAVTTGINSTNEDINCGTNGHCASYVGPGLVVLSGNKYVGGAGNPLQFGDYGDGTSGITVRLLNISITGSTGTCGIQVVGNIFLDTEAPVTGSTGATWGVCLASGAIVDTVGVTNTITGTSGDFTLDGTTVGTWTSVATNHVVSNLSRHTAIVDARLPNNGVDINVVGSGTTSILNNPGLTKSLTNQVTSSTQTVQSIPTNGKIAFDGTAPSSNPPIGMWWDGTFFHIPGPIAGGTGLVTCNTLGTTYFVSTTGNDSNACTASGASACLTIQGALNKIAKCIQVAPVTLNIGAGTFACASAEDFQFDSGGGLWIQGTLAQASLTGSMSGTIASATAFNQTGAVPASVTVTAAGWTVNALQGYFLQITGGPGNGEIIAIQSNTATTLNLGVDWQDRAFGASYVIPTNSSTFSIVSPTTIINTSCNLPASPGGFQAGGYTGTGSAGLIVSGIKGGVWAPVNNTQGFLASPNSGLLISGISFTNATGAGIVASNSDAVHARWNWFGTALTGDDVNVRRVGQVSLFSNYTTRTSASALGLVGAYGNADKITLVGNVTNNQPEIGIVNYSEVTFPVGGVTSEFNWINTGSVSQQCVNINGTTGETYIYGDQCQGGYQIGYYSTVALTGTGIIRIEYTNITNSSGAPSPCAVLAYGGGTTVGLLGVIGSTGNTWGMCAVDGARILLSSSAPSNSLTGSSGTATLDLTTAISYANLSTNGFYSDPSRGSYIGMDTVTKPAVQGPVFTNSANPQLQLPNPVNTQNGNNILDARTTGACALGSVVSAINVNGVPTCTPASLSGTSAGQSLFVDCSLGNDSNACTASGASACLTIQGAISKVPQLIKGPTTISVAAGTCAAGAYVENFQFAAGANPNNGAYLKIFGQLTNSTTLNSGSATGTASSASNGDGCFVKASLTDTTQGWTAANLRGRFLVITGGTGVGQIQIIEDNTATVITVARQWATLPTSSSTYAVRDSTTTINGNLALPASGIALSPAPIANYAAFIFSGNSPSSQLNGGTIDAAGVPNPTIWLEGFRFVSPVNLVAAIRNSPGVGLVHNQIVSYASANAILLTGPTRFMTKQNSVTNAANSYYIASNRNTIQPVGGVALADDQIFGGGIIGVSSDEQGCYTGTSIGLFNVHSRSGNATNGLICYNGGGGESYLQHTIFDSNSSGPSILVGGQSSSVSFTAQGSGTLAVYGAIINNSTGDAIQMGGPQNLVISSNCNALSGTGNTGYGIHLIQGARAGIDVTTSVTGTAGDTSVDGVRNTSYTSLATAGEVTNLQTGSTIAISPNSTR